MNWTSIYDNLIQRAKSESRTRSNETYYERHHIIPRYMNGSDDEENLVLLTFREHVIAHYLLWRMYGNKEDQLMYKMRSGQREEAQRVRVELAVEANRNGGNGFWKKGGWNPMKDPALVKKSLETKIKKYGKGGIYSKAHYDNVIAAMKKPGGLHDPLTIAKATAAKRKQIDNMTPEERKARFSQPGELNGNWGISKGYYIVIDPDGNEYRYESQDHIMESLGVSQSFLVRNRNTGVLNSTSRKKAGRKWNGWTFNYYKVRRKIK